MLDNYQKGIPLVGNPNAVYNEQYDLPDLSKLDLTEIDELRSIVSDRIEVAKEKEKANREALSIVTKKLREKQQAELFQKIQKSAETKTE